MTREELQKQLNETYYSSKNAELLPAVIILSILFIFTKQAIAFEIILWSLYAIICIGNNERLRNDPHVIQRRNFLIKKYGYLLK